tara:strand:- start:47 stop:502 length:456 start_codon:yes stop_codon:yes gene_type:complete
MKITINELKQLIKETISEVEVPLLSSPDVINEVSLMRPRARDMFGKRVYWRDMIRKEKTTKSGRKKIDYERVINTGIIDKPSQDYPDGGLPGYRETREPLLRSDQPIVATLDDGDKARFKENGQEITLLDLLDDREVRELMDAGEIETSTG